MSPAIDMSDALTDTDTLDIFNVIRRAESINGFGESSITGLTFPNQPGIVYPTSPDELERLPDQQLQAKTISIRTRFPLRGASEDASAQSWQPDLIVWNGDNYVVTKLGDWGRYGTGFISAECKIIDLIAVPPSFVVSPSAAFQLTNLYKVRAQSITQISSTQFSVPVAPDPSVAMLFRNGQFLSSQNGDYTLASNVFTLTTPLGSNEFLAIYA